MVAATLCALAVSGCPVDDRALEMRPGLVFLTGSGGDMGMAGAGADGSGAEAGQTTVGQSGDGRGGSDGCGGARGLGGDDDPGQGGAGGSSGLGGVAGSIAGGSGFGGSTSAGSSGAGGGSGGHLPAGRCPDLDANFIYDCDETLAKNSAFDSDASEWDADTNVVVSWVSIDASGRPDSGAVGVEDTYTADDDGLLMVGAHQCIPVAAESDYRFAVQVSVPDGAESTRAGIQVLVYGERDCAGDPVDVVSSDFVSGSAWKVVSLPHTTPTLAKSLMLRLVSIKPHREAPCNVLFDNVLVHAE